jgi:hypothetical protein
MKTPGKIILAVTLVLISFTSDAQEKEKATSTKPVNSAPAKVEYRKLTAPSKKASIENRSKIVQPIKKDVPPRNTIKE